MLKTVYALKNLKDGRFISVSGFPVIENSCIVELRIRALFTSIDNLYKFVEIKFPNNYRDFEVVTVLSKVNPL